MLINSERQGNVLTLVLNDPVRRNAMGDAMRSELRAALLNAATDPDVRTLILRGSDRTFCSGGDLRAMPPPSPAAAAERLQDVGEVICLLARFPKPTLALVEGAAAGLGAGLALACDYVFLSETARFLFPFTRLGLLPDAGTLHSLGTRVGTAVARQLLLEAASLDAATCLRTGLADAVHPESELSAVVGAKAAQLAGQAPLPVAAVKAILGNGLPSLDAALDAEVEHQPRLYFTADFREGKAAFAQHRTASFSGA